MRGITLRARRIERAFASGWFSHTGGDEFVALRRLQREAGKWRGEKGESLKLAAGYALAADHPGLTSEKPVHEADLQMYEAKAEYFRKTGLDRRRHFERLREQSKEDNHERIDQ